MQNQEIGQFIIKITTNTSITQSNNTGNKQGEDTDITNFERIKQVEKVDFDAAIHAVAVENAQINNTEDTNTQISQEWGSIPSTDASNSRDRT